MEWIELLADGERMTRIDDEAHSGGDCVYIIYYKNQFSSLHTPTCSVEDWQTYGAQKALDVTWKFSFYK